MSRASLLFLLAVWEGASAAAAVPLHVGVRVAGALSPSRPIPVILRVTPQPKAGEAFRIKAPGQRTLDLGAGPWRIEGEAEGYWSAEQVVVLREGEESAVEIHLYPTGTLRGRVELPRGQKPPDRLDVRFLPSPAGSPRGGQTEAGSPKGVLSCPVRGEIWECAVPAGFSDLRIRATAMAPVYRWGLAVQPGKTLDLGVLALRPGASVVGRVVIEAGLPARAVRVELATDPLGAVGEHSGQRLGALALQTLTNDRGFFQFQGVAPGSYAVTAFGSELVPARVSPVLVREGLEAEIVDPLILARPVTLAVDLRPPVDPYGNPWRVRLLKESNAGGALGTAGEGMADREGRWSQTGLAPGKYRLSVLGDLGSRWVDQQVEVLPGDAPFLVEIPVIEVQGLLTLGDSPLAGTLWFGGRSGFRRVRFDADEKGGFAGFLPAEGTWAVDLVSESEGLKLALEPVEVRVRRGDRAAEVEIRVPDTTLEGEVVEESGRPVPGAHLSLTGNRKFSEATAGDEGRFKVRGLAPGSVFVEAEEGGRSAGPFEIPLEEGRASPRLRLVLRRALEIKGRVVSAAGPVPGAEVMAWPALGEVPFASSVSDVTGPDGSFTLHFPAETSSVALFVSAPGHAFRMAQVPVERGRPIDVPVQSVGGTLVLELPRTTDNGRQPSPLLVHGGAFTPLLILARWASLQRFEQTDPGRLVVPNVEPGDYSLCLNASAELRQGKEPSVGRCTGGSLFPNGDLKLSLTTPGS